MKSLVRKRILYLLIVALLTGMVVSWPQSVLAQAERVKYQSGNNYLIMEFLDDDLVHFELSAFGPGPGVSEPVYTTPMVHKTNYSGPSSLTDDGNGTLETPDIRVQVNASTLCVTATDKTKDPDLVLTTICPLNLHQPWKGVTFTPESFTHAYGLGQEFITPGSSEGDWVGRVRSPGGEMGNALVNWNGGSVGNTQFPIVYLAGNHDESYALFMDNQYKQNWDFRNDPWTAEMWGDWLRFYIMTGPDLQDLRKDYMELVGHPLVPPKKMFGLWVSEYGFDNWAELEDKLSTLRASNFPIDGFVLDLQWFGGIIPDSDESPMGSLAWDLSNFPDPEGKIANLRDAEGIGVILIEESYISENLAEHTELESRGYLARDCETCGATYLDSNPWWGKGGMIDWSNDAAGTYWHDWKREPLIDDGVIGHWTDLGEPEMFNDWAWYWGIPGDHKPLHQQGDVHNLYNLKWSQSIYEGYVRNARIQRPFILARSGAPGSQRYGVSMWSGDIGSNLSSLATHLNAQMHMSMSGIDYYGADIGGQYRSALDGDLDEMYTQWFANGMAFDIPGRPHTNNLCNCNETAPDRIGDLQSNLANLRQRYELSPYMYTLSHRAYLYGEPVIPPLVYYYQSDPNVREMGHEKLLGRDLLVAIVAAHGETERNVYLPVGDWINYHTNEWLHSSGEWFGPFPEYLDGEFKLPMFARAGAIIPQMYVDDKTMNIMGKRTDGSMRDELIVRVYADDISSNFTLYEDDGETIAYQNGVVRTTIISQQQAGDRATVTIGDASGSYAGAPSSRDNAVKLIVNDPTRIISVTLNDISLPQYQTQAEFDAATSGWFNPGNNLVVAKSGETNVTSTKTFEFHLGNFIYLPKTVHRCSRPFTVDVDVRNVSNLSGFEFTFAFDPNIVHVDNIVLGSFLTTGPRAFTPLGPDVNNSIGQATFGASSSGSQPAPNGSGPIATITFIVVDSGTSALDLTRFQLADSDGTIIPAAAESGSVTVLPGLSADVDCDCDVDIVDIMLVASRWHSQVGDPKYDPQYDRDGDGDIDIVDIMLVASHWGESCTPDLAPRALPERAKGESPGREAPSGPMLRIEPESSTVQPG